MIAMENKSVYVLGNYKISDIVVNTNLPQSGVRYLVALAPSILIVLFPFGVWGRIWDLVVLVPHRCLFVHRGLYCRPFECEGPVVMLIMCDCAVFCCCWILLQSVSC